MDPVPLGKRTPVMGGRDLMLPGVDVRLAATQWRGAGPPVVLLHGLSSQRHFWDLVLPGLAGLAVLAIDQRGHGDSGRPNHGPYDVSRCADDVAVAMDAVGIDRAVLVGHSWGASVAAEFGARSPSRTLAVVTLDGALRRPLPAGPSRAALRVALEPPNLAMSPTDLETRLLARLGTSAAVAAVLAGFAVHDDGLARSRLDRDRHLQVLDGMLAHDPIAALLGLTCPAWVVACDGPDRVAAAAARPGSAQAREEALSVLGAAGAVNGSRLRVLRWAGAEHDVPLQWPALVSGLVRAAVEEVATGTDREAEAARSGA